MAKELAIDLGTVTTQVVSGDAGLIIDEPTVAAVETASGEVLDIGRAALSMAERSGGRVMAVWPMQHGVVSDDATIQRFVARLLRPLGGGFMERMRVVVVVPTDATPIERRTVREACKRAGAAEVHLIEQVIAVALGSGLPVHEPVGTLVVNVGAGLTEAGLISLGSVVATSSARSGGADVDEAIRSTLRRDYGVDVSDDTAEDIKITASELNAESVVEARGRLLLDDSTATAILERADLETAIDRHTAEVLEVVRATLVQAPPELAQDVIVKGIFLSGGGAMLVGLADRIATEFDLPVHILDNPAHAAAFGARKCADAISDLKPLFVGER